MKRLISLTMSALMVGSLLPMSAFAATGDGWHYDAVAGIINKTERQQINGDNKIGMNMAIDLYSYDLGGINANDSALEPWEVATANAPEVQIKVASITPHAGGSFDLSDDGKPYIISEFDVDITDAVLAKVTDYVLDGAESAGDYKITDNDGDIIGSYNIKALDEYDVLHLVSITRDDKKTAMRDILNAVEGSEGYDEFPDIYVTSLSKRTVGGVNGVDSFTIEVRSHASINDAFVEDKYVPSAGTGFDAEDMRHVEYNDTNRVTNYNASLLEDKDTNGANGKSTINNFVSGSLLKNDIISIKLPTFMKSSTRSTANIAIVSDDFALNDNYNYATLVDSGMSLSYTRSLDAVAEQERIALTGDIVIKEVTAGSFDNLKENKVTFKLSKGFEFYFPNRTTQDSIDSNLLTNLGGTVNWVDQYDEFELAITKDEFTSSSSILETLRINATTYDDNGKEYQGGIYIEATTAKVGDVATIEVLIDGVGYGTIEVAEVVDYLVLLEVDTTQDVPVMFSGVNRDNDGLSTNYKNNHALEVTIRETFPGAWNMTDGFAIRLPEQVYVVNDEDYDGSTLGREVDGGGVIIVDVNNLYTGGTLVTNEELYGKMEDAYEDGGFQDFEFGRRPFDGTNVSLIDEPAPASMTFQLVITGSYGFEGPVELGLELYGCDVNPDPVVIAEFVKPFEVGATSNDVIIDYRNTLLATDLTFVEYEAGLLTDLGYYLDSATSSNGEYSVVALGSDNSDDRYYPTYADPTDPSSEILFWSPSSGTLSPSFAPKSENYFSFKADRGDYIQFEGASFNINTEDSDAEFREWSATGVGSTNSTVNHYYDTLYFHIGEESRNVPMEVVIDDIELYMQRSIPAGTYSLSLDSIMLDAMKNDRLFGGHSYANAGNRDLNVGEVYRNGSTTVDSDWINVITAGSDKDNAFLTKIVVPIGSSTIYTSARTIDLNATEGGATPPAYINANNWTMVPVRAVAEALGDSGIMVTWDNDNKAVGIIYPDRVISIVLGEKVATVNGTSVPLNESLEMIDNRVYLPFRDLGNLLGVDNADINYDAVSRTAIINGSVDDIAKITGNTVVATTVVEDVATTEEVVEETTEEEA